MWTTRASLGHARWGCRARGGHLDAEPAVEGVGTGPSATRRATPRAPPRAPVRRLASRRPAGLRPGGDAPPGAPASATPRAPDDAEGVGEAPAEGRGAGGLAKGCRRMWRMWQGIEARRGGATTHLATPRLDLNETAARERRWRRATVLEYAPTKLH